MREENMVLMAYDECGDEVRVNGFYCPCEIHEDEDSFLIWKMMKEEKTSIPEEWGGIHWVDVVEEKRYAQQIMRDFFF